MENNGKNIYQRLHAVMQKVKYVQKEERKVGIEYTYVSHDTVTALCRTPFIEEGIVVHLADMTRTQTENRTEIDFNVAFVNIDNPGDRVVVPTCGYGIDEQDKGVGKAISYGFKYAILKTLCLETGDDPEKDDINFTGTKSEKPITPPQRKSRVSKKDAYKKISAKFDTSCTVCHTPISMGQMCYWNPAKKGVKCQDCNALNVDGMMPWPEEK